MGAKAFLDTLWGKTRSRIFALLFLDPDRDFYVREIVAAVGAGSGSVQRELKFLHTSQLVIRNERGNQVHYRINQDHPLYPDLVQIVRKTVGAEAVIRDALTPLLSNIVFVAIFGSYAAQKDRPTSDIDVLVVGSAKFGEVVEALADSQRQLGREINPVVYDPDELKRKLKSGNHFLMSIVKTPMIFVLGAKREFERVVKPRLDRSA